MDANLIEAKPTRSGATLTLASGWTELQKHIKRIGNIIYVDIMATHGTVSPLQEFKLAEISGVTITAPVGGACAWESDLSMGSFYVNTNGEIYVRNMMTAAQRVNVTFCIIVNE